MIGLSNMVTPRIEPVAESRNYGKFEISPLERGYGITLGNALRRVLLSALDGAAITSRMTPRMKLGFIASESATVNRLRSPWLR